MALLDILEFPDPRLRTKAKPVDTARVAGPAFQQLLDDMFETMYAAPGIGLAASQVDVHQQFMVIDVSEDQSRPMVFVNPRISARSAGTAKSGVPAKTILIRVAWPRGRPYAAAWRRALASFLRTISRFSGDR